jgi:predicted Zn-dependent peptidase
VEKVIYAQIDRLMQEPIADWELQKARNATRLGFMQGLRSAQSRATALGVYTVKYGDPNLINTQLEKIEAVSREDVQRVAKQYLQARNRTVITTLPQAAAKPAA